jgi:archaeosine-15-forming tRNA-guanine transglycosylase
MFEAKKGALGSHHFAKWVIPEKNHYAPKEEICVVRAGEGVLGGEKMFLITEAFKGVGGLTPNFLHGEVEYCMDVL